MHYGLSKLCTEASQGSKSLIAMQERSAVLWIVKVVVSIA